MENKINFENLTIGQVRKLTEAYMQTHEGFKTAGELLEEKANVEKQPSA